METTKKSRAEPKTDRKLKPAPRAKKNWTPEEDAFLQDKWGSLSIPTIAKQLGRSVSSVENRRYRIGCSGHLKNDHRISLNQLIVTLYGAKAMSAYITDRLIQAGLPVHWHKVKTNRFHVVDLNEFWQWAEQNRMILDFSRFEEYSLGAEPDWVKEKRKADFERGQQVGRHNTSWTKAEDEKLKRLLKKQQYGYRELARELRKTDGAVKRRICDLQLKERPVKAKTRMWTESEIEILCDMVERGYKWEQIAEKLGRSALATRGKYERLLNPSYMQRYYRGRATEYQDIHSMKPSEVLARHKAMLNVEFSECPPRNNYNKDSRRNKCRT